MRGVAAEPSRDPPHSSVTHLPLPPQRIACPVSSVCAGREHSCCPRSRADDGAEEGAGRQSLIARVDRSPAHLQPTPAQLVVKAAIPPSECSGK